MTRIKAPRLRCELVWASLQGDEGLYATEIQEHARKLMEAHGDRALAEAAQKAVAFEKSGDAAQARVWRQIEAALNQMRGPHQT